MSTDWKLLVCNLVFIIYTIILNLIGEPMPMQIVHGRRTVRRVVVTTSEQDASDFINVI